jgi:hypothetical protein
MHRIEQADVVVDDQQSQLLGWAVPIDKNHVLIRDCGHVADRDHTQFTRSGKTTGLKIRYMATGSPPPCQ